MGTLRFFEEVVSFKIRRTFGFADYRFFACCVSRLFSQKKVEAEVESHVGNFVCSRQ